VNACPAFLPTDEFNDPTGVCQSQKIHFPVPVFFDPQFTSVSQSGASVVKKTVNLFDLINFIQVIVIKTLGGI